MYERRVKPEEETPEERAADDLAARVNEENAAKAKAEAEAKAYAEQSFRRPEDVRGQRVLQHRHRPGLQPEALLPPGLYHGRGGVTQDDCDAECADVKCDRTVNGVTTILQLPGCGDVPAHKDSFGDKFQRALQCAAMGHRRQLLQEGMQERRQDCSGSNS